MSMHVSHVVVEEVLSSKLRHRFRRQYSLPLVSPESPRLDILGLAVLGGLLKVLDMGYVVARPSAPSKATPASPHRSPAALSGFKSEMLNGSRGVTLHSPLGVQVKAQVADVAEDAREEEIDVGDVGVEEAYRRPECDPAHRLECVHHDSRRAWAM